MKQKVLRQTLSGSWTAFTFDVKAHKFFVKNFTNNDIFVSFVDPVENSISEDECYQIASGYGQELYINNLKTSAHYTDTIYVKGTGAVEVDVIGF